MTEKIVTRFAPSPTGFLHIGGVRTALFAYLWTRKNNGTFILRIEDTDQARKIPGSIEHIQETLSWLSLEWDYGPDKPGPFGSCIQSERLDTYITMAHKLIEKELAYPDPYSAEEVETFRKQAVAEKRAFLFRDHRPTTKTPWDEKRPLRFLVPEIKRTKWHDAVRGDLEAGEEALDDFILMKADGYPTYNFAHIVDDYHMGITHIMRADEFISSTPRFLSLYGALEIEPPIFVTLPPILREDRTKKLGKRDGAKDILEYRDEGYLPEAMINFLALIGWNPGSDRELFSKDELLEEFALEGIQSGGAALNEEKLRWFNREYVRALPKDVCITQITEHLLRSAPTILPEVASRLAPTLLERVHVWGDIDTMVKDGELSFAYTKPDVSVKQLSWKGSGTEEIQEHLTFAKNAIETLDEIPTIEDARTTLWEYAEKEGKGNVLWPLRMALTGQDKSPDPFSVIAILGKTETLARINTALQKL